MGFSEVIVILAVGLLVFGPKKLPEIGKALGNSVKAFKDGIKEGAPENSVKET